MDTSPIILDTTSSNNELLAIGAVSKLLGVTPDTVRNWEKAGRLTSTRTAGGHRRYRRSDIARLIEVPEAAS